VFPTGSRFEDIAAFIRASPRMREEAE
jgi:hypothetical protein